MGSYGSGYRRGSRYTVDGALGIPIGWIVRQSPIKEGCWRSSLFWKRSGETLGSFGYILTRDHEKPVGLKITCERDGKPFNEDLILSNVPMPKGGFKTYLVCPYCRSQRLSLYFSRYSSPCCRKCANYTYQSSQESTKHSGMFRMLVAGLEEEARWDRKLKTRRRQRESCKEWRKRKLTKEGSKKFCDS